MSVAPKHPNGPPLNAMRAFDAAARHVSFVLAAEELSVTPGAISQHIKTLEAWAGVQLFRRNAQGVVLTPEGRAIAAHFTVAFDGLADATRALRNLKPNGDFQIAALPSIAQLWLPKRLSRVRERFPEINFSITAMETAPSLARGLFDLSIFFAAPDSSCDQIEYCNDEIVPVCAPKLLDRFTGNVEFDSLTLLHDQTWESDWSLWSKTVTMHLRNDQLGPRFSLYSLAVEEAKAGAGILMGHVCLLEDALASGELVRAHEHSCETGQSLVFQVPLSEQRRVQTDGIVSCLAN